MEELDLPTDPRLHLVRSAGSCGWCPGTGLSVAGVGLEGLSYGAPAIRLRKQVCERALEDEEEDEVRVKLQVD